MTPIILRSVVLSAMGIGIFIVILGAVALTRRLKKRRRARRELARLQQLSMNALRWRLLVDAELVREERTELGADTSERQLYAAVVQRIREREGRSPDVDRAAKILQLCRARVAGRTSEVAS